MKRRSVRTLFTLPVLVVAAFGAMLLSAPAYAGNDAVQCGTGKGGVRTSFDFGCPGDTDAKAKDLNKNPIYVVLLYVINTMAIGVGVVVTGGIIWFSIQYASANGKPDKAKAARNGIVNAVIALLLFLTMYAILNFIIPGGVFDVTDGG